jgi:hypothetical protein
VPRCDALERVVLDGEEGNGLRNGDGGILVVHRHGHRFDDINDGEESKEEYGTVMKEEKENKRGT